VDKKTGGLVVTNTPLPNGADHTTVIPAGTFIFGKYRDRHLHPIHKDAANWAEEVLEGAVNTRRTQSLDIQHRARESCEFAARAMAGLKEISSDISSSSLFAVLPPGRSTPSAKGTADKHTTWRRLSVEEAPRKPRTSTTTSSAKGTADKVDSWRRHPLPQLSIWTPVVLPNRCNVQTNYVDVESEAASLHPLDYAIEGMHTEMLSHALDEFMEASSSPKAKSSLGKHINSESCSFTPGSMEDLLVLSKLSGKPLHVKSKKAGSVKPPCQ
jgi:hypothetical protein